MSQKQDENEPMGDAQLQLVENEKGALSYSTSTSARVDLFFKTVRGVTKENLIPLLAASWNEDPLDTLKLIFYCRDCRGGKGERQIFRDSVEWLIEHHVQHLLVNLGVVTEYGRWEDLLWFMNSIPVVNEQVGKLFAEQLKRDRAAMEEGKPVSLCAKWAPSENAKHDKKLGCAKKICAALACNYKEYRRVYLSPLREYIKVTERLMCGKRWSEINYSKVPSVAMNRLKKAFKKNDAARFDEWTAKLAAGDKSVKVNASVVEPHEIVRQYFNAQKEDVVAEEQWKVIVERVQAMGSLKDSLVLSDVSGSMSGTPMEVAVAMGILIASLTSPPFTGQILTFETNSHFHQVTGSNLFEKVKDVLKMTWGGSTNIGAAFDCILNMAQQAQLPPADMPKRLYIISDMQFDQACEGNWGTTLDVIKAKYAQASYPVPEIVFWNVRANTKDFVAQSNTPNVAMIAGFSPSLLKAVLTGKQLTPFTVLRDAIDVERYSKIKLAEK